VAASAVTADKSDIQIINFLAPITGNNLPHMILPIVIDSQNTPTATPDIIMLNSNSVANISESQPQMPISAPHPKTVHIIISAKNHENAVFDFVFSCILGVETDKSVFQTKNAITSEHNPKNM
jgi:hypothetical protein